MRKPLPDVATEVATGGNQLPLLETFPQRVMLPDMETGGMSRRRGLLTDGERELLSDPDAGEQRYVAVSRVRTKIEDELAADVRLLAEHRPDLLDELRDVVCEDAEPVDIAAETSQQPPAEPSESEYEPPRETETSASGQPAFESLRERAEAALDELDIPGRPAAVERTRRKAVMYAWERLREEGAMKPSALANDTLGRFWDDPDLNYSSASGRYAGYQLWDNCVRTVLRELPGVHPNSPKWTFHTPEDDE